MSLGMTLFPRCIQAVPQVTVMLKDILVFLKFLFFHPIRMPEYITACRMLIIIVHFTRVIY